MIRFKEKYETLITNKFKINLYGPNGCGKTKLTHDVIRDLKTPYLYLKLNNLINIESVYEKIKSFIIAYLNSFENINVDRDEAENMLNNMLDKKVSKFFELYEIFNLAGDCLNNIYFIIDGIDDPLILTAQNVGCQNAKNKIIKYFNKIISLCNNFEIKIILISNFDFKSSETKFEGGEYDDFIPLLFPKPTLEVQKEMMRDIYGLMDQDTSESICISQEYCLNYTLGNFQTSVVNLNKSKSGVLKILEQVEKWDESLSNSDFNNKMKKLVKSQVSENLFVAQNVLFSEENTTCKMGDFACTKFTESLSKCQKLIIVSAFIAGETNSLNDCKVLKSVKTTKFRFRKTFKNISKVVNWFNLHRLTAIYASLFSIVYSKKLKIEEVGIEFMCDINTLYKYNLIRTMHTEKGLYNCSGFEVDLNKKIICNVNFVLADFLAREFDLNLDDFMGLDICY